MLCATAHLGVVLENIISPLAVGLSQQYLQDQALEQMGERSRGRNSILLYDCFLQSSICKSCLHMKNIKASRGVEGGLSKTSEELPCSPNVLLGAYVPSWTLFACLDLGLAAAHTASCKTTPRISLPQQETRHRAWKIGWTKSGMPCRAVMKWSLPSSCLAAHLCAASRYEGMNGETQGYSSSKFMDYYCVCITSPELV